MNPSSLMSGKCVILYCTIIGTAHSDKYSIPGFVIVGSRLEAPCDRAEV